MQASQQPRDENILILNFFKRSEIQLWGDSPYLANITVS